MTNKTQFCSFYALFCTFCASLWLKRTVFTRLQIKVRPKGLHNFAFYILIFNFSSCLRVLRGEKIREIRVNPWLLNDLRSTKDYVRKNNLFMQNEPNFQKVKFNVTKVLTTDYDQLDTWSIRKNEPKTNPIQTQFKPNSNPIQTQLKPKQTQYKPKQTQFKPN